MRRAPGPAVAVLLGVGLALLVALPLVLLAPKLHLASPAPAATPPPPPAPYVSAMLQGGPAVGSHLANPFFAVVLSMENPSTRDLTSLGNFLNTTPITWFRVGGGGEGYDPTSQTDYLPPIGAGGFQAIHDQIWNLDWFKGFCDSHSPHCLWLGYLPGEENDSGLALSYAEWYHTTLGLAPTLWEFANEPEGWSHYNEPTSVWSTLDNSTPSGPAYATMVKDYIAAIAPHFPGDRYVGIEASCACNSSLITDTAALNAPELSAMAYHSYPAPTSSDGSLGALLGALTGATNLSQTSSHFASLLASSCARCGHLPIEVGEYQAGPAGDRDPLSSGYPGALFLGASVIQALETNVSMFTVFDSGALFNSTTGTTYPEGLLYQRIFANLTMGTDVATSVPARSVGGVYSIVVDNGSRQSLFVVNTNATYGVNLTVPSSVFPTSGTGSDWLWYPVAAAPVAHRSIALAPTYQIPPEGIFLAGTY